MALSKQEIQHIAKLARLELSDEELKKYGSQLSDILNYIDQLKEVDTSDVKLVIQDVKLENVLREDVVKDWPKDEVVQALSDAPEKEERFIKVRRVIE